MGFLEGLKIHDISMEISENMMVYKNRAENMPSIKNTRSFDDSNIYESEIRMNLHTGTHIDMPLHVLENGKDSGSIDLKKLIVPCRVIEIPLETEVITRETIEKECVQRGEFIIFKTKNSFSEKFDPEFTYISDEAAGLMSSIGVAGVGIDALGIERGQEGHPAHKAFLKAGVVVIEGLRLAGVSKGSYILMALPLKIKGVEAVPARAILLSANPNL